MTMDSLRHDLIQIVRRCGKLDCVLTQPMLNKILNGDYKAVIDEYERNHGGITGKAQNEPTREKTPEITANSKIF